MNFDNVRCFYSVQSFGEVVSFQGPEVKSKVEAYPSEIVLQWVLENDTVTGNVVIPR